MNSPFFDSRKLELLMSAVEPYIEIKEPQIVLALICAYIAHGRKADKAGAPYFEHPIRICKNMATTDEKIIALLHDVLEDSSITEDNLRNIGFSDKIVETVKTLTRRKTQSYNRYLTQVLRNPLATKVKRADIQDNLDPLRLEKLSRGLQIRLRKKYEKALLILDSNESEFTEN